MSPTPPRSKKPNSTELSDTEAQKKGDRPSIFHQPSAVWAISFACMVSFMGIGLVDPILPAISRELNSTPSQTMLLFTSYLLVTSAAMFFAGFISSRLGVKRTLTVGLALIVLFATLAGTAGSVDAIIGFRAGWGLGNALFISTALAAIVGAASGGSGQAIILYEAALGVGLAVGPLVGGALGSISWRMPFFGTAALMTIGLAAVIALLPKPANTATKTSLWAGFKALRRPQLLLLSTVALCYNFGFFTLLAYSPYPLEAAAKSVGVSFGAHELGLVFFGWGLALAFTSVLAAPRLTRRFGLLPVLSINFAMFAACLITMAIGAHSLPTLVGTVVAAGLFLGVLNTALTEAVMEATDLPRSITSSTYSGVRFLGGAVAPLVTGPLAEIAGAGAPYCLATAAVLGSMVILVSGRGLLADIDRPHVTSREEASAITAGDEV